MYKVIVAGTRTFEDYDYLCECLDEQILALTEENDIIDDIQIVSGGAKGADSLGERYAKERGYSLKIFPAEWNKYGKAAGPKRNEEMAKYADACICFWDRKSRGTAHMISLAEKYPFALIVNELEEAEIVTDYDDKIQRTEDNQRRYEENKNIKNNNMEGTNMNNNKVENNNKVVNTLVIVNRAGKSLVMNGRTNKYAVSSDANNSSVMASLNILANLVEKMERTDNVLNIVLVPKSLGGILKLDVVNEWIANGNKTAGGKQLTQEYVDLVKYINDMRKYLGSNNLILKVQGGTLINKNEKAMINNAWLQMDKVEKRAPRVKPQGDNKPAMPASAVKTNTVEF